MVDKPEDIEAIYNVARQKTSVAERSAYLDAVCGNDSDLRARVEELLTAQNEIGDFLESPPIASNVTVDRAPRIEGPGTVIGHYELLELTGEGGMGLVYLAEQKEPVRRRVAFKIIKPGMDSRQVIARFEAERQALAVLDHPNIAKVFDAGTTETGRPYFVMEYVRGMSITRYCDENKLTIEQRLWLFEQVCEAVQHAHQKGIIHRDLKPSNILVSIHGDRAVPKIIDFGIAKAITQPLTDKTFVTLQGHLLGTPEYMSPEQVDLATQDIDTRSDIYSLGVVLYELLAGVLPFESEIFERVGLAELQQTIRETEPASPSIRLTGLGEQAKAIAARRGTQVVPLARRLHRELEWIPLKAMRKDRCRRYKSASDLADDVRNYLNGNPLLAGPETAVYRVQKFARKHAGSVTTLALVAAAILLGLILSFWQATVATKARNETLRANAEKDRQAQIAVKERDNALVAQQEAVSARQRAETAQQQAEEQRQRTQASEEQAQRLLYAANMNLAQQAWEQNHVGRLRELLAETAGYPDRGFEWYYWQRQAHLREIRSFYTRTGAVWSVAFSPDGRYIITSGAFVVDGAAKVWEVDTGKELFTFQEPGRDIRHAAFSPDGRRIITGCGNAGGRIAESPTTAKVWDAATGKELYTFQGDGSIFAMPFSPDGQRIITGWCHDMAKVWELATGRELSRLEGHHGPITFAAFSPDGQRILTSSDDTTAKIWDANSGKELMTFRHAGPVRSAFSSDGERIATISFVDQTVRIWDANSGKELSTLQRSGDQAEAICVTFSPDGERIATGCVDGSTIIWEAATGKELLALRGHSTVVWSVAFSPDGERIVTGSHDGTTKLWDVSDRGADITLRGHDSTVRSVAFFPDNERVCTGSHDGTTRVWEVAGGKERLRLKGHAGRVLAVAVSPDGQFLATGGDDRVVKLWKADTGEELLTLPGHSSEIQSIAFSPDGRRIVTGSYDATAKVWEADSGKELSTLKWHEQAVYSVAFSPDGRRIATASNDRTVKIWEAASGKELLTAQVNGAIWSVMFSPDGQRILTSHLGGTGRILEAASGRELLVLKGHDSEIRPSASAFSPDGRRVVTTSSDKTAKVWDAATGKELLTLRGHHAGIRPVGFSPDGQRIVTGDDEGLVKVWETACPEQVAAWEQQEEAAAEWAAAQGRQKAETAEHQKALRAQDPGAVKQWLVLAPLPYEAQWQAGSAFSGGQPSAPAVAALDVQQLSGEVSLRPRAGEHVKVGQIERIWKTVRQEDNRLDLNRFLGEPTNYSAAYAVCYIDSEAEQAGLVMKVSSGDPLKVYLNGQEIHRREKVQRQEEPTSEVSGLALKAGRNVLVLKTVNLVDTWRVSVWLTDAAGQPLKGIRVTLEPPEQQ